MQIESDHRSAHAGHRNRTPGTKMDLLHNNATDPIFCRADIFFPSMQLQIPLLIFCHYPWYNVKNTIMEGYVMADSGRLFRTALSGFHKGDVTAYIEKTALQHRSQLLEYEKKITDLQEENRSLQQQLNLLMMATPVAAPAPVAEPAPVPAPAPEPAPAPAELMTQELQAYRRAEAVERNANARARKLYQQLEGVCQETLDGFQLTDSAVKQAIDAMMSQVTALEQACQTLSAALNTSREKLAATNEQFSVDWDD
jgi:cell division septum initiation protein DivIVA